MDDNKDLTNELNANHLPDDLPVDTDWEDDVYTHQPGQVLVPLNTQKEREDNRPGTSWSKNILEQINLFSAVNSHDSTLYC